MSYTPAPPPFAAETAISRYTYDELLRIAQALEEAGGVSLLDFHGITSSNSVAVNKFGKGNDFDTANAGAVIWDGLDITDKQATIVRPMTTTPRAIRLTSSSVNDDVGGSGAERVRIYGLPDWDQPEANELVDLDGTTASDTTSTWVSIHRMVVEDGELNEGLIEATFVGDGTANATARIVAGNGQTLMAMYSIPEGKTLYITDYYASVNGGQSSLGSNVELRVNPDPGNRDEFYIVKHVNGFVTEGSSLGDVPFVPFLEVPGPAVITMNASVSVGNTEVSGGFNGYLRQD